MQSLTYFRTPFNGFANYVKELNVDGIVAVECFDKTFISKLLNLGKPVVFNDFAFDTVQTDYYYDIISTNDEKSVFNVVKSLQNKYKLSRFTFVGDRKHCKSFHDRYIGMLLALTYNKISHTRQEDILCSDAVFNYGNPESLKTEILKLKHKPECYICCNDFVARNVSNAIKLIGQQSPKDALIVGFDDVADAYSIHPYITSLSVDKQFLGIETMRALITRIETPNIPSREISIQTKCIYRETTDRQT